MNINPSDGSNFGYGSMAWKGSGSYLKSNAFKNDFLDPVIYEKKIDFIAIARHDGNELEAVKVWKFKVAKKALKEYFTSTNPGRQIVTEGGHIQFNQIENLRTSSQKGNRWKSCIQLVVFKQWCTDLPRWWTSVKS